MAGFANVFANVNFSIGENYFVDDEAKLSHIVVPRKRRPEGRLSLVAEREAEGISAARVPAGPGSAPVAVTVIAIPAVVPIPAVVAVPTVTLPGIGVRRALLLPK